MIHVPLRTRLKRMWWRRIDALLRKVKLERQSQRFYKRLSYDSSGRISIEFRNGYRVEGWVHPTPDGPLKKVVHSDNPIFRPTARMT